MKKNKLHIFYLILFALYLLGGCIAIILSQVYNFHREGIGIAILLGAIVSYLLLRKVEIENNEFMLKNIHFKFLTILFILLSIPLLLIFNNSHGNYFLPIQFFIIISIMAALILIQILFSHKLSETKQYFIIIEIFALSILLSSSFLFLFPGPYGNDASYHVGFIQNILETGTIGNYFAHYTNYPIFHVLFVSIVLMTGIHDFKIIQFILSLTVILSLLFIFILVKRYSNEKIALMSLLLISTIPYIIQSQYMYFPMSYSVVFFILSLYLFLNINQGMSMTSLFILSFITLNTSHPLSPLFFIIISAIIMIISSELQLKKKYLSVGGLLLLLVLLFTWWMKPVPLSQDLFSNFLFSIRNSFEGVDSSNVVSVTLSSLINVYSMILYDLGWVILSFLGIVGAFYGLKKMAINEKSKNEKIYFFIITLILIPLPYVLTIIYPQSMPDRWFPFVGLFIGISASFGVFTIFKHSGRKKLASIFLVSFVIIGIFFNITTPIVNPNSQIYAKELSGRSGLTSPELDSVNFLNAYSNSENVKSNSKYLALAYPNSNQNNFINPLKPETYSNGTIIIRKYDIENGFTIPLYGKGALLKVLKPNNGFFGVLNNSDQVYSNGDLKIYYN